MGPQQRSTNPNAVLKDLDLDVQLLLEGEALVALGQALCHDTALLRALGVIDYSLLLGVHYVAWEDGQWRPPEVIGRGVLRCCVFLLVCGVCRPVVLLSTVYCFCLRWCLVQTCRFAIDCLLIFLALLLHADRSLLSTVYSLSISCAVVACRPLVAFRCMISLFTLPLCASCCF